MYQVGLLLVKIFEDRAARRYSAIVAIGSIRPFAADRKGAVYIIKVGIAEIAGAVKAIPFLFDQEVNSPFRGIGFSVEKKSLLTLTT